MKPGGDSLLRSAESGGEKEATASPDATKQSETSALSSAFKKETISTDAASPRRLAVPAETGGKSPSPASAAVGRKCPTFSLLSLEFHPCESSLQDTARVAFAN